MNGCPVNTPSDYSNHYYRYWFPGPPREEEQIEDRLRTSNPLRCLPALLAALGIAFGLTPAALGAAWAQGVACAPLVEEAWQAVADVYLDPDFNGVDWDDVRADVDAGRCPDASPRDQVRALLDRLGDPAVRLVPPDGVAAFLTEMSVGSQVGPGLRELLSIDIDERTGLLTVVTPVPDGPAARAGIRTGDVVEAIDGVRVDTMDLALAMRRLRGPAGSGLRVRIRRDDNETRTIELARERIEPAAAVEMVIRRGPGDAAVAYIRMADFSAGAAESLAEAVSETTASNARAIVLDLRDNPGGLVPELVGAAELFLDAHVPITRLRSRPGSDTTLVTGSPAATRLPLAVLVNGGSASAAEALAGGLQAADRAVVLGQRTFGKGLAHTANELSDGSLVLIPGGRLETPRGRDILREGIEPDIEVAAPPLPTRMPAPDAAYRAAVENLDVRHTPPSAWDHRSVPLSSAPRGPR